MRGLIIILCCLIFQSCQNNGDSLRSNNNEETEPISNLKSDIDIEQKLASIGVTLPVSSAPQANYVNAVRTGNLVFMAGKGPKMSDGSYVVGKVGGELTIQQGYDAARQVAILQLAALKEEIGDLNKVKRIVKVLGMVNCVSDFGDQPKVVNGFSDFMVEVFGPERGKHARAAVGMASLPKNMAVEIEMIVEVYP